MDSVSRITFHVSRFTSSPPFPHLTGRGFCRKLSPWQTRLGISSASPPGGNLTAAESAWSWTAVRRGCALTEADIQPDLDRRRPGQSTIVSPRKEVRHRSDSLRAPSKARRSARRFASGSGTKTPGPRPTPRWPPSSGPRTPTTLTRPSSASAPGPAAAAPARARPSGAWPPAPSPRRFCASATASKSWPT